MLLCPRLRSKVCKQFSGEKELLSLAIELVDCSLQFYLIISNQIISYHIISYQCYCLRYKYRFPFLFISPHFCSIDAACLALKLALQRLSLHSLHMVSCTKCMESPHETMTYPIELVDDSGFGTLYLILCIFRVANFT